MEKTGQSVPEHLAGVTPARRREDAEDILAIFGDISGREPEMWSSGIVGFGSCHYRYPTGNEGDMPLLAFAPRNASMTVYEILSESLAWALGGGDEHAAITVTG